MPDRPDTRDATSGDPDLTAVGLLIAGPFCLIVGLVLLGWNLLFFSGARTVEGEVINLIQSSSGSDGDISYKPEIRYTVPGGETFTRTTTWATNPPAYRVGDKLQVLYDPDEPGTMVPDDFMGKWMMSLIFLAAGNIFTIFGLVRARKADTAAAGSSGQG